MENPIRNLSKTEQDYYERCVDFAETVIRPLFKKYDEANAFPEEIHREARGRGILHAGIPREWGGLGLSPEAMAASGVAMARVCAPATFTMGFNHGTLRPILKFGTEDQKRRFVRDLLGRAQYASWCMTEPEISGSSLFEIRSTATRTRDGWVLEGTKCMIGNGAVASQFLVLARTIDGGESLGPSIFVVPRDSTVEVGPNPRKLGFRCLTTPTIRFHQTAIPADHVLGGPGQGIGILLDSLDYMRFGGGIVILGLIQGALRALLPWLEERDVFGGKLVDKSHVQVELGRIVAEAHAVENLLWTCAARVRADEPFQAEAASLKLLGSELAMRATDRAVQMMGWRGIDDEHPVQKLYRDARQTPIFEGTTEVVASALFQSYRMAELGED